LVTGIAISCKIGSGYDDFEGHMLLLPTNRCLSWLPGDRPSFREILHTLEHIYKEVRGKAAGEVWEEVWRACSCLQM
jgi:hypothetical protein